MDIFMGNWWYCCWCFNQRLRAVVHPTKFPPLQESVFVILTIVAEWHGRDVLAILMCSLMHIKSEHNICYVCVINEYVRLIYVTVYFFYEILRTSHSPIEVRWQRLFVQATTEFLQQKGLIESEVTAKSVKTGDGFLESVGLMASDFNLKNRNVPWQMHRNVQ